LQREAAQWGSSHNFSQQLLHVEIGGKEMRTKSRADH